MSTKIEWTDSTWNPMTGCTKQSSGCLNCYAEKMARRLKAMNNPKYAKVLAPDHGFNSERSKRAENGGRP